MYGRPKVLVIVLAGGEGKRLYPLTRDRAKPAVPFGGHYRLIDFVLSNMANARFTRMVVLTQYKSHSLDRHVATTWRLSPLLGNYVAPVPAQMRRGPRWFAGSADAIYQNFNIINDERPDYVLVFGADHIYRMDPAQMLDHHMATGAGVTVAGIRVPVEEAGAFGVIDTYRTGLVRSFLEKPDHPPSLPNDPRHAFVSMGNYCFSTETLVEAVSLDAADETSRHDMGGNVIPSLVAEGVVHVYDFADNVVPGQGERERGYWRDVGTLDSFFEAHMDLVSVDPVFDLYNDRWPIYTWHTPLPPAKFVFDHEQRGSAVDSLVCNGAIVSGGTVRRSVLSPRVRVEVGALVEDSVLMDGVTVGRGAVVRRAILDKNVEVPDGFQLGVDPETDAERYTVSDGGVAVIGKDDKL